MAKKRIAKTRSGGWDGTDPLGIRDINSVPAYQRDAADGSKNIVRERNEATRGLANTIVPNVTVSTDRGKWDTSGIRNAVDRGINAAIYGKDRQVGSTVSLTQNNKPKTSTSSFNPQNAGGKGARKMAKNAKEDAKRSADAAPEMETMNNRRTMLGARRPIVVEQMPSGLIIGRDTKAKATSSRGAGARKMAKGKQVSQPIGDKPYDGKPIGDKPYGGKPIGDKPSKPQPIGDKPIVSKPIGDQPISGGMVMMGKPMSFSPSKVKTNSGSTRTNNLTRMAKNQGAYINGKPASANLTKVREKNPHSGKRQFAKSDAMSSRKKG